jgi:hypothetical protein
MQTSNGGMPFVNGTGCRLFAGFYAATAALWPRIEAQRAAIARFTEIEGLPSSTNTSKPKPGKAAMPWTDGLNRRGPSQPREDARSNFLRA